MFPFRLVEQACQSFPPFLGCLGSSCVPDAAFPVMTSRKPFKSAMRSLDLLQQLKKITSGCVNYHTWARSGK